jgi:type I restriction enzyme S subunit
MRILKHKSVDYSEISLSELGQEMRFDADYWEPSYLKNEGIITTKKHTKTKNIAPNPQYGISVAMNEEGKGYSILKMDNIMEMLAEDKDAKFADVSEKIFKQFQLKKFDVLFNRVNSDDFVGRTGIYLIDGKHTFASYLVKVDSGKEHTNCYLTAYLNCKYGKTALHRVKRRAVNQANINAKELGNLNIPTPSDALQKQIQILIVDAQKQKQLSHQLYQDAHQILFDELGLTNWKCKESSYKLYNQKLKVENTVNIVPLESVLKAERIDSEYWLPKFEELLMVIKKNALEIFPLSKIILFNQRGVQPLYVEGGEMCVVNSRHIGEQHIDYNNLEKTDISFFNYC